MATAIATALVANLGLGTIASAALTFGLSAAFSIGGNLIMGALTQDSTSSPSQQERTLTVRQTAAPWRILMGESRIGGTYAFLHATDNKKYLYGAILFTAHESQSIDGFYFNGEEVPVDSNLEGTGDYKNKCVFETRLGKMDQTAFDLLRDDLPSKWTADHRLAGHTAVAFKLTRDRNLYATGVPTITVKMKGYNQVYNPRTDTTGYSTNAIDCTAAYLTNEEWGLAPGGGVDADNWIGSGNISDENVALDGGGTEKRYTCNGWFSLDQTPERILENFRSSFGGDIVCVGSTWHLYAGAWRPPTFTLTKDIITGPVKVQARRSYADLFSGVKGKFVSPDTNYQEDDFPAVISVTYTLQDSPELKDLYDGGSIADEYVTTRARYHEVEYPFTDSPTMCQRLAKIELLKIRQQISVKKLPLMLSAFVNQAADNIKFDFDIYGWSEKEFNIRELDLVVKKGALSVVLSLQETHSSIFDWSTDEENPYDPAPDTNFPNPFDIGLPSLVTAETGNDTLAISAAGVVYSFIKLTITPADDYFVDEFIVTWMKAGGGSTTTQNVFSQADSLISLDLGPVIENQVYNIKVYSFSAFAGKSANYYALSHLVEGKSENPGDVDNFYVSMQADGSRQFDIEHLNPDLDVRVGGGYNILFEEGESIDIDTAPSLNKGLISTRPYETNLLAAGEYTFACQVVDSSGNKSENPKIIQAILGNPRLRNSVAWRMERELEWPGILTDCFVNFERVIEAKGSQDYTALPDTYDEFPDRHFDIVESKSPITYLIAMDVGGDLRFNPLITVTGEGSQTVDMRSNMSAGGSNLSALPWGVVGQVTGQYVEFLITMTGPSPVIRNIMTILDGEILSDDVQELDTSGPDTALFERLGVGHFKIATAQNMAFLSSAYISAFQGSGFGWDAERITKATTLSNGNLAAEFKIAKNEVMTDCIVDVILKGPKEAA